MQLERARAQAGTRWKIDGDARNAERRLGVEIGQPIESLRIRQIILPTQAEVERQSPVDVPIILDEEREILAEHGGRRRNAHPAR